MLLQFIHLAADFFTVFWSCAILFMFILLGIKYVFIDRKFDEGVPSDGADVPERAECVRSDAEAVERKLNNLNDEEVARRLKSVRHKTICDLDNDVGGEE